MGGMSPAPAHACLQLSPSAGKSVPGQSCSLSSQLLCTSEHHCFMYLCDIHQFPLRKPSWRFSCECPMGAVPHEGLTALCGLCSFLISWCPETSKLFHGLASPSVTSEEEVPVHESRGQWAAGTAQTHSLVPSSSRGLSWTHREIAGKSNCIKSRGRISMILLDPLQLSISWDSPSWE